MRVVEARKVVEIGVNEGRTARAILRNVSSIQKYIGVDVLPGYLFSCETQRRELPQNPGHFVRDDSRFQLVLRAEGSKSLCPEDLGIGECDVVFVDGDHSLEAVQHDTHLAERCVRKGGMIIWHDYHGLETVDVRLFLETLWEKGREIWQIEGTWLAIERRW